MPSGKGGGGNAHNRAIARAAVQRNPSSLSSVQIIPEHKQAHKQQSSPTMERIFKAFESPLVQTPISVVGGVVGALFYGPVLALCTISVLAGVHRSGALAGLSRHRQAIAWPFIAILSASIFVWAGFAIDRHRRGFTLKDIAQIVWNSDPHDYRPVVRVINWERVPVPMIPNQTMSIRLHLAISGERPVKVKVPHALIPVDGDPESLSPEQRKKFEDTLWDKYVPKKCDCEPMVLPVGMEDYWIPLEYPDISRQMINDLHRGKTLYALGKIVDMNGNTLLEFCAHTGPDDRTILFCTSHN